MTTIDVLKLESEFNLQMMSERKERAQGAMLGLLIGDALGAAVEGWPASEIRRFSEKTFGGHFVTGYVPAIHMGTVVGLKDRIGYKWASEVEDMNFVGTGPNSNPALEPYLRCGNYTDDGNTAIALAASLVECQKLDGAATAKKICRVL